MSTEEKRWYLARRGVALLIDTVPVFFVVGSIQIIVSAIFGANSLGLGLGLFWFPAWVLARVIYHTPLEGLLGWTPGKLACGLRVRSGSGERAPGLGAAFVRSASRAVDGLLGNLVGAGYAGVRQDGRRIGDWFSDTTVEMVPAPLLTAALAPLAGMRNPSRPTPADAWPFEGYTSSPMRESPQAPEPQAPSAPLIRLEDYVTDLTERALSGGIGMMVGRELEVRQVIRTLGRTQKNNPILVGEAGVGKTAVAEGLARITAGCEGEAPKELRDKRVLELDLTAMEAGARWRGDFEERLKAVLDAVREREDVILFLDEMHRLMSAGSHSEAPAPAAQILKPALARGEVTLIGATTRDEWRHIERDAAMERRFQPIPVPPLSVEATTEVLKKVKGKWERTGEVLIEDGAVEAAAPLAERYLRGNLPDKALSLVDDAVSGKKVEGGGVVGRPDLEQVIEDQTGIKVRASATDMERLRSLEDELRARVVGQDRAARVVARTVQRRAAIGEDRPASLLFLGPTGVGKTEMAKALTEALFGTQKKMVRIDMSEFQNEHMLLRLTGAARGYKESEQGGQLTEAVRREPYSVVLLDEIEKAHPQILTILLQLLDEGRLTDGLGREVDFTHAIVLMTSNAGAERILAGETDPDAVIEALRARGFPMELIGRMDERVVFEALSPEDLEEIVRLLAKKPLDRVEENRGVRVSLDPSLVSRIAREGGDPRFGARELRGLVRRYVEEYLTERIMYGDLAGHRGIVLWYDEDSEEVEWYDPEADEPDELLERGG